MSMKRKHSIAMLRVSAATALVTASVLGAVVFFAAPVEGAEKTHHLTEVTHNEEAQGTSQPEGTTRTQSAGFGGQCLLVLVDNDNPYPVPDDLHNENTIRLPARMCIMLTQSLKRLVDDGVLDFEADLQFKQYY